MHQCINENSLLYKYDLLVIMREIFLICFIYKNIYYICIVLYISVPHEIKKIYLFSACGATNCRRLNLCGIRK